MNVLIVDDHTVVREGLSSALIRHELTVVAQAASVKEACAQIARTNPDAVLVDLNLPDGSGLEIITWVRSISSTIGLVVLTINGEDEFLIAAMKSGANAYISKSAPMSDVISALRISTQAPQTFMAAGLREALARSHERFGLSPRELEVLTLLPSGKSAKDIGKELFLSEPTIKTHMSNIYRKLDVHNRTEAITKARAGGLLK